MSDSKKLTDKERNDIKRQLDEILEMVGRPEWWILDDDHTPRKAKSLDEYAQWEETHDRHVADTHLPDGTRISTVFLGLDHSFNFDSFNPESHIPILFETMVFRDGQGDEQDRYATWNEAVAGHSKMVEQVMGDAFWPEVIGEVDERNPVDARKSRDS